MRSRQGTIGSIDFPTLLDLERPGPRLPRFAAGTEEDA
jgi:hypothetical protein